MAARMNRSATANVLLSFAATSQFASNANCLAQVFDLVERGQPMNVAGAKDQRRRRSAALNSTVKNSTTQPSYTGAICYASPPVNWSRQHDNTNDSRRSEAAIYATSLVGLRKLKSKRSNLKSPILRHESSEDEASLDEELFSRRRCKRFDAQSPCAGTTARCGLCWRLSKALCSFARSPGSQVRLSSVVVDELQKLGIEIVFLNRAIGASPEEDLLLQMQGMFAEYERAKIMERSRRGKRHAATRGSVNVLSAAPYGYRYITRRDGDGQAAYEINDEQAAIVRQVFQWVGRDRLSIGEVTRRLTNSDAKTATGKDWWDRTTVWGMLKNPAYKGSAAFGKTRTGPRRPQLRTQRGHAKTPRRTGSTYDTEASEQLSIPVPAIVSEELFDVVQKQLTENRQRGRETKRGAKYFCKACWNAAVWLCVLWQEG